MISKIIKWILPEYEYKWICDIEEVKQLLINNPHVKKVDFHELSYDSKRKVSILIEKFKIKKKGWFSK